MIENIYEIARSCINSVIWSNDYIYYFSIENSNILAREIFIEYFLLS